MDLIKHKLIEEFVLKQPLIEKEKSNKWSCIYTYGDDKDFISSEHFAPIHAFRIFSKFEYPIYLFINFLKTGDLDVLLNRYPGIIVTTIEPLKNSFEYNYWFINKLWYMVDTEYVITCQNDGFLLKSGYEGFIEENDFDYIGAVWKDEVKLHTKNFNLPPQKIGNGGFSARKPSKMREVLNLVNSAGGQDYIVEGQSNDGVKKLNHSRCAEDSFFANFGFGMNIFNPVTIEQANQFSLEPIPFDIIDTKDCPFGFHRCDN